MSDNWSGWAVGWAAFAAIMLMMVGVFQVFAGLAALASDNTYYVVGEQWLFKFDPTAWGGVHIIWGGIVFLAGIGIFGGNVLARTLGVIAAGLSALASFAWMPYQPVWASIMIAVAVAVIWALTVHGRDIAET